MADDSVQYVGGFFRRLYEQDKNRIIQIVLNNGIEIHASIKVIAREYLVVEEDGKGLMLPFHAISLVRGI